MMMRSRRSRQRRAEQIANAHPSAPVDVRSSRLEVDDVVALDLNLLRILDDGDALAGRNRTSEHVQERRLAATGPARDQHVQLGPDEGVERTRDFRRDGSRFDQTLYREAVAAEAPNRDVGTVRRCGRDHCLQARTVGEAPLQDRVLLVHVLSYELRCVPKRTQRACSFSKRVSTRSSLPRRST